LAPCLVERVRGREPVGVRPHAGGLQGRELLEPDLALVVRHVGGEGTGETGKRGIPARSARGNEMPDRGVVLPCTCPIDAATKSNVKEWVRPVLSHRGKPAPTAARSGWASCRPQGRRAGRGPGAASRASDGRTGSARRRRRRT